MGCRESGEYMEKGRKSVLQGKKRASFFFIITREKKFRENNKTQLKAGWEKKQSKKRKSEIKVIKIRRKES